MGSEYRHRVIRIDVTVMSHFTHLNMRFTGFLALFMRSWYPTIISKRGCALYTKLRSIHHFKGLDKGCVLYTGASYTREITVRLELTFRFKQKHISKHRILNKNVMTLDLWRMLSSITELGEYEGLFQEGPICHRPFLRSAIQVVGDFGIVDFDRHL